MTDASRTEEQVATCSRSLMRRGNTPHIYRKQQIWHRTAGDTNVIERRVTTTGDKPRIGHGSLMITVESIQQRVVGSSISPIRLEKRLPLPSMPAH